MKGPRGSLLKILVDAWSLRGHGTRERISGATMVEVATSPFSVPVLLPVIFHFLASFAALSAFSIAYPFIHTGYAGRRHIYVYSYALHVYERWSSS